MKDYLSLPEFKRILEIVQEKVSKDYAGAVLSENLHDQLPGNIKAVIRERNLSVEGLTEEELTGAIYNEMAESSFLTELLVRPDIEEININSWDDVAVTLTTGEIKHLPYHFMDKDHAIDIVKRLLKKSDAVIDDTKSVAEGHLPGNKRITAIKEPIVSKNAGISASIRLLHTGSVNKKELLKNGTYTEEIHTFLSLIMRKGISIVFVGATSSGKTTLLNSLLTEIPDRKRIFVIESGTREIELVRKDKDGKIVNNVVGTITRKNDSEKYEIDQKDLVMASLRFSPNVIVVGEMRDKEAHAAVEASLTGHQVVTTVHAGSIREAHERIALLMERASPIDFNLSLYQAVTAFPVVCFTERFDDNKRRITEIAEGYSETNGNVTYRTLFKFLADDTEENDNGTVSIKGHFERKNGISDALYKKLLMGGALKKELSWLYDEKESEEKPVFLTASDFVYKV